MTHFPRRLATCAWLLCTAAALPAGALAASSAASSASDSVAASSGSISGSIEQSSNSSSKGTNVSEGDYKIIEVAAAPQRPGLVRVQLQPVAQDSDASEFALYLPQDIAAQSQLAAGGVIAARNRPYGIEFAQGPEKQAFYLVLKDEWHRELQSHPVVL